MNIGAVKKELEKLGIPTSTPGLAGDERFEELCARLRSAQAKLSSSNLLGVVEGEEKDASSVAGPDTSNDLSNLTIGELRSRLSSLGLNSETPGLSGEQRCKALRARLVAAICGQEPTEATPDKTREAARRLPPERPPPVEEPPVIAEPILSTVLAEIEEEAVDPHVPLDPGSMTDFSDLKKALKRISNRRALVIASQLSGDTQDASLKKWTRTAELIEVDLTRCRGLQGRGESRIKAGELKSNVAPGAQALAALRIETVVRELEEKRAYLRDLIRDRRQEIRDEAEAHEEYGLQVEENIQKQIASLSLQNSKVSKARRRLQESKALGESLSLTQPPVQPSPTKPSADGGTAAASSKPVQAAAKADSRPSLRDSESTDFMRSFLSNVFQPPGSGSASHAAQAKDWKTVEMASMPSFPSVSAATAEALPTAQKETSSRRLSAEAAAKLMQEIDWEHLSDEEEQEKEDKRDEGGPGVGRGSVHASPVAAKSSPSPKKALSVAVDGSLSARTSPLATTTTTTAPPPAASQTEQRPSPRPRDSSRPHIQTDPPPPRGKPPGTADYVVNTDSAGIEEVFPASSAEEEIRALRQASRELEQAGDYPAAEVLLQRALALDPTHVPTLQTFAVFLHHRRGEVSRAEAFFNRALQLCMPDTFVVLTSPKQSLSQRSASFLSPTTPLASRSAAAPSSLPSPPSHEGGGAGEPTRLSELVRLLLSFASFVLKAKGDIEAALVLLERAYQIAPEDARVEASLAHFLAQHHADAQASRIDTLFRDALRHAPGHCLHTLWYAKYLKHQRRNGPAELMYKSAVHCAQGDAHLQPTAICNYATFLFKQRKKTAEAQKMFEEALQRFPRHKGLRRNYGHLRRSLPRQGDAGAGGGGGGVGEGEGIGEASASSKRRGSERAQAVQNSMVRDLREDASLEEKARSIMQHLAGQAQAKSRASTAASRKTESDEDGDEENEGEEEGGEEEENDDEEEEEEDEEDDDNQ